MPIKKLILVMVLVVSSLSLWGGETGLFTYEGGFFIKTGTTWKEYRPKDKPGVWATYTQYNEETNYYNIKNANCTLSIPKASNNNFYKNENGKWVVVYNTRVVYPSFVDSSVRLFCFKTGFYVRDDKVCVPKRADLNCFLWNKSTEKWEANYAITEIYDHI